jgi:catechol 2,3-dioxygenase-like lactoylglutathione lyase family enzyme
MLQHASLEVPEALVGDCVAFWELLGFTSMAAPPRLGGRFTWVEREGTQIHLIRCEDPGTPAREGHVAVVADDYDRALAALADAGFQAEAGSNAWDAPRSFVRDPAGHLVEVMSRPPLPPFPEA